MTGAKQIRDLGHSNKKNKQCLNISICESVIKVICNRIKCFCKEDKDSEFVLNDLRMLPYDIGFSEAETPWIMTAVRLEFLRQLSVATGNNFSVSDLNEIWNKFRYHCENKETKLKISFDVACAAIGLKIVSVFDMMFQGMLSNSEEQEERRIIDQMRTWVRYNFYNL